MSACEPSAARVLGSDATVAVGRFSADGVSGYRARSGGPLRATRAEAEADEVATLDSTCGDGTTLPGARA